MAWRLSGAKPLSEPIMTYYQPNIMKLNLMELKLKLRYFHSRKYGWNQTEVEGIELTLE